MADDGRLAALLAEIAGLDRFLLEPIEVEVPAPLTSDERRAISAYLVLVHGDVEEFIEALFYDFAVETMRIDENGRVDPGLYQAVVRIANDLAGQLSGERMTPEELRKRVPPLLRKKVIMPNNGIKRDNLKRMSLGVGLDWPRLDAACADVVAAMHGLGALRGAIAHRGAAAHTGLDRVYYPTDVRAAVDDVTGGLPTLVEYLGEPGRHTWPPAHRAQRVVQRARSVGRDLLARAREVQPWRLP